MATGQLKTFIPDIAKQRVVLPQFQRDFVWSPGAVIKLLVSLFNGYPIGSLLLMENNDSYDFRAIDGVLSEIRESESDVSLQEKLLVLDGQQRLTACYRAFVGTLGDSKHSGRYYFNYNRFVEMIKRDEEVDGSNLEDLFEFVKPQKVRKNFKNTADETSQGFLPLDIIFGEPRGSNYADWLNRYNFAFSKGEPGEFQALSSISSRFITRFVESVTSYQINYEVITRDTKPDVICTVFETINTTGVKLTVFDLLVAKCFKKNIRLRDQLDEAVAKYENIRFFDPNGNAVASIHLPRIIGLMHNVQCKKGDLLQLSADVIGENWLKAVVALDKILGLMRSDFGCTKPEFIPSIDVLSPLAVIVSDIRFSRDLHSKKLLKLYWNLVFSLYLSGAPETKSSRIVREWREAYRDSDSQLPEVIRNFSFSPDSLDDANKNSSTYKGVLTMIIAEGARDFGIKRAPLRDSRDADVEDHHIYPQQFLRTFNIKGFPANSVLNRTPIFASTNRAISADAPHIYIANPAIVGDTGIDDMELSKHCISSPLLREEFSPALFTAFRKDRRIRLLKMISAVTGQDIPIENDAEMDSSISQNEARIYDDLSSE